MFKLLKTEGTARRGVLTTPHGTAQTPVFMNVGTQGAIKGAVSAHDLVDIGCQIVGLNRSKGTKPYMKCNVAHLYTH